MPSFAPLRVRGGFAYRLRRAAWRQRRTMAAGLALTAAALAASGAFGGERGDPGGGPRAVAAGTAPERAAPPVALVSAPVRIADAAAVRLLRPGDRVDVVAPGADGAGGRVLAEAARVDRVPSPSGEMSEGGGALVVLSVPRTTATRLAGAGMTAGLAVVLC
ncbi:hypothetical protein [Streptomyces sp. NPDC001478]